MHMQTLKNISVTCLLLLGLAANGQNTINLQGEWQFTIEKNKASSSKAPAVPKKFKEKVILPGSMLTNGKGDIVTPSTKWVGSLYDSSYFHNPKMEPYRHPGKMKFPFFLTPERHFVGNAWYMRTVEVPEEWQGKAVTLFLERPHIETTVFVNGQEVGHQMSLSTPHQYDVSKFLIYGKKNKIAIKVYNGIENVCVGQDSHSVTDQTQGDWNGIVGTIELRTQPIIYRKRVEPDIKNASARIFINDTIYNIELEKPLRLWSEDNPQLYTVEVDYHGAKIPVTFGMREIGIIGSQFTLNDIPIWLRGTVENCCFPETGYAPTDVDSWLKIFGKCKEYGLNHMRFHSFCPPEAAFAAADKLGMYLQPEGPSWPNHGVRLRRGMAIDTYLTEECKRIIDTYGSHPSFIMMAAGNEPAGDWVSWGKDFIKEMKAYDPSRVYTMASVGGGWAWDEGSEYHVKGGARGLDWDKHAPQSTDNFNEMVKMPRNFKPTDEHPMNTQPYISHEQGQWCAFPDFKEIDQYTGVYKPGNLEIFRDLLEQNGMASQAEKFLMSSGKLQTLAYKYEMERNLRSNDYAGFQLLSLNDYSGQGTALVGVLNVHWKEKGYCTASEWREFCSEIVPMALFPSFVFTNDEIIHIGTALYNTTSKYGGAVAYSIYDGEDELVDSVCTVGQVINLDPSGINKPTKLRLTLSIYGYHNHYDFWVYPKELPAENADGILVTDTLDRQALDVLGKGGKVLLCAAGKVRYGNDVKHTFLPVFWNTSWFKMRPPHTTGCYIQNDHPVFSDFPTDDWQNLNWWELVNRTQVMNLAEFPANYQPIVQPIDTWHVSRKLGMMVEANVLGGKLLMTSIDISNKLDERPVARQLRHSIIRYMKSENFNPTMDVAPEVISHLYEKEAPPVNMFTKDSPDELKPKLK